MTWSRTLGGVPPEEILGALASLPGSFLLCTDRGTFAGALPSGRSTALDPDPLLFPPDTPTANTVAFPRWVGILPYEGVRAPERTRAPDARPPALVSEPAWQRYDAVVRLDRGPAPCLLAVDQGAGERLQAALATHARQLDLAPATLAWAEPPEPGAVHEARIARALEHIARGNLYQVNLARRFSFELTGLPLAVLGRLAARGQSSSEGAFDPEALSALAPYAAAIDFGDVQVVSTSPESFLELGAGGAMATRPIKGTRPRNADPERDRALAAELDGSEKERAELAMVIDIERNDLGRLALPGSVRLEEPPSVVSLTTVHHRQALVTARLAPGMKRSDVLRAMMPSGSVTGAPKVRAMDLIRELEAHRRGLYTGALGGLFSDGCLELSMAIRCLVARGGRAEYFTGGGIVADSDPKAEVQETLWKAEQLLALLETRSFDV